MAGVTSTYFVKKRSVESSVVSYDQAAAQRLWQLSAELTGLVEHGGQGMGIFRMYTGTDGKSVIEELSQDDPILRR